MLITERIFNPSPRGIHLRQSGMSFKTGWFSNIFYLSPRVLKSMFSSINRFETSYRARVGNFCFTYEIWVQSKLVSYAFRAFATFLIFVGILVILTHSVSGFHFSLVFLKFSVVVRSPSKSFAFSKSKLRFLFTEEISPETSPSYYE